MRTKFIVPVLLVFFCLTSPDVAGQEPTFYPSAVYNSLEDYLDNNPSCPSCFRLEKIKSDETVEFGAFFRAKPVDPQTKKVKVGSIKKCWGVLQDGVLYMNVRAINEVHFYTPIETRGRYLLAFVHAVAGPKGTALEVDESDRKIVKRISGRNAVGAQFGLLGALAIYAATPKDEREAPIIPVIIDTQENLTKAFTAAYGQMLAERHPEMAYSYEYTGSKELDALALIKYISDLNDLVEARPVRQQASK